MVPEFIAIELVLRVIVGIACAAVASSKGRNAVGWFFLGFFFFIIPLIIVACLHNLKTEKADRERVDMEQHRLREQLRQERLKNEAFRQFSAQRLDAHDQVLGVNTRSAQALPGPEAASPEDALAAMTGARLDPIPLTEPRPQAQPPVQPPVQASAPGAKPSKVSTSANVWYYERDGAQQGPVSAMDIKALLDSATIRVTTLVWTEGLADWVPVNRIPWFRSQVAS